MNIQKHYNRLVNAIWKLIRRRETQQAIDRAVIRFDVKDEEHLKHLLVDKVVQAFKDYK